MTSVSMKEKIQEYQKKFPNVKLENLKEVNFSLRSGSPAIDKLDGSLSIFKNCEQLNLSTNLIEKITALNDLKKLKVLSIGRNNIKTFVGLDAVANTLEQLWISYNNIERTRGIDNLKKLKVLYITHNNIKKWEEFDRFANLPNLEDFRFCGNPLHKSYIKNEAKYIKDVTKKFPKLKFLEGNPVIEDEESSDDD